MTNYSHNLRGECEADPHGLFFTLRRCQAQCRPLQGDRDTQEAAYLVLQYDLDRALSAAPSDRVQVIRRLTGTSVSETDSYRFLEALVDKDYPQLYSLPAFHPYLREQGLDELDFLLLGLLSPEPPWQPFNWSAIRRRIEHRLIDLFAGDDDRVLYELANARLGYIPLATIETLEKVLQRYVYENVIREIVGAMTLVSFEQFQSQWPRLLAYFQIAELPYTEYIGQVSDDGFFGIFAAEEAADANEGVVHAPDDEMGDADL